MGEFVEASLQGFFARQARNKPGASIWYKPRGDVYRLTAMNKGETMKKIVTKFLVFAILAVMGLMPTTAFGSDPVEGTVAASASGVISACPAGTFRVRRSTRTKKKLLNAAVAGGIGAALGAGIGGKRGALIGVGSGAGGYLTYRYIRDRRGRCVRSYRRG